MMTKEQINEIAQTALAWAEGSWGQSRYDKPRYSPETMKAIYHQISELASSKANFPESK
jgi:hypothetical protein